MLRYERVVWCSLPLSCETTQIVQTGRCLNDRLRERSNNVNNGTSGFWATHRQPCGCKPVFNHSTIASRGRIQLARELMEAEAIGRLGDKCVSSTSLALTDKEGTLLAAASRGS